VHAALRISAKGKSKRGKEKKKEEKKENAQGHEGTVVAYS
jgi:hypothetical protein